MNNKKLNLLSLAKGQYPALGVSDALAQYLRNKYSSDQSVSDLIAKYLYESYRWVYNFDGIDDRAALQFRAINPEGDIDIEFKTGETVPPLGTAVCIVDQSVSNNFSLKEFYLQINTGGNMQVNVGGNFLASNSTVVIAPNTLYRMQLVGDTLRYFRNGVQTQQSTITRGTNREPNAVTKVGSWSLAASFGGFYQGQIYDVRINGVLWPIVDNNQTIQLPNPTGLGPELITQSVLENPASVGSQWTYLGDGRWQLISDGNYSGLTFISPGGQPEAGFVEFEIESISGGSIRCSEGTAGLVVNSQFNTPGIKRWYFIQKSLDNRMTFSRNNSGVPVTAVIKNISYKPLWVVNAAELLSNGTFNTDTAGWSAINSTVTWSSGTLRVDVAAGVNGGANQNLPMLTAGKYYLVTATVAEVGPSATASVVALRQAAGSFAVLNSASVTAAGAVSFVFMATASDAQISLRSANASADTYCRFDNVSVRELNSLCNPMVTSNFNPDRWREVPNEPSNVR